MPAHQPPRRHTSASEIALALALRITLSSVVVFGPLSVPAFKRVFEWFRQWRVSTPGVGWVPGWGRLYNPKP
jgi:hypothetical protein